MNLKSWTAGIAVLTLAAAPVFAEEGLGQWSYDQQINLVGCDACCDDACCGDDCCGGGCDCGCGVGGGLGGFSLAGFLGLDDSIDFGGWTQLGYTSQATLLTPIGGGSFNDTPDSVNLHQQWFYMGKEADGSKGVDLGFRWDMMYGIDAGDTQAFSNPANSFDEGWDHGNYGWAIPQLYAELAAGDFSVKVGHFYTLVGYEVVTAPDNFFYSHALTMYNSEPFTHTGIITTYSGFEGVTLYNGWTAGWDTGFDSVNSGSSYLGGFSVDLLDSVTLTYINTYGNFGAISQNNEEDYSHSIVVDVTLTDSINYVFQTDYKNIEAVDGTTFQEDIGINQYLFYNYNDILSFGSRIEWWRQDQRSHYEYTSGVNVRLLDNLVFRPEYRQDWVPELDYEEELVGMDMILTY